MKFSKKVLPMVLAMAMIPTMSMPAFAADSATTPTTAPNTVDITNHTFVAYQIFTGTLNGAAQLSDVNWGLGVNSADLLAELKTTKFNNNEIFKDCKDAAGVAEVVAGWSDYSAEAKQFAKIVEKHLTTTSTSCAETGKVTLPAAGYYLVVDTTATSGTDNARNLSLLEVAGAETVTVRNKTSKTTLIKKVKDVNDSIANSQTGWQDSADYDIGDHIPYQLTATLGDLTDYDTYKLVFHDTMTHLTLDTCEDTSHGLVVKVGDVTLTNGQYTLVNHGSDFTITIDNVKEFGAAGGETVTVDYYAVLGNDAAIGSEGNPNESYLEYSNNPNGDDLGRTPEDTNIVFTYSVVANKVDGNKKSLEGAAFELWKKGEGTDEWNSVAVIGATKGIDSDGKVVYTQTTEQKKMTKFEFKGIDDGHYKISEVVTPAGYNSISDMEFDVTAEHDILSDNPQLSKLTASSPFKYETKNGKLTGAVSADIVNKSGSTLPETGGIGTTIFYVVGVVLMLGAGVLLITKRRMSAKH